MQTAYLDQLFFGFVELRVQLGQAVAHRRRRRAGCRRLAAAARVSALGVCSVGLPSVGQVEHRAGQVQGFA